MPALSLPNGRLAALSLALALALASGSALADTLASSNLPFPLANSNQVFPARSNRLSLKCYNPTTNAAVVVTYASGFVFTMAPGASLWETSKAPSGKVSATGTAAQILYCEELYQVIGRRAFAAGSAALAFPPLRARAQLFNPGAATLGERDGLVAPDAATPPDAQAALDWQAAVVANGGTVSAGRLTVVQNFIAAEMAAGTWALTDDYWGLWAENAPQALTSLKQKRLATVINAPTFTPDRDYTFNGTSQHMVTGFVASTHAVAMTGSNQRLAAYERTNINVNATAIGIISGVTHYLRPRVSGGMLAQLDTTASANLILPLADSRGFSAASRAGGGTTIRGFKNGVALTDITGLTLTSNTLPAHPYVIAALSSSGTISQWRPASIGFACVGAPLSGAQEAAQYANVQAWATAVGASV